MEPLGFIIYAVMYLFMLQPQYVGMHHMFGHRSPKRGTCLFLRAPILYTVCQSIMCWAMESTQAGLYCYLSIN